jgi:hypothetical protein
VKSSRNAPEFEHQCAQDADLSSRVPIDPFVALEAKLRAEGNLKASCRRRYQLYWFFL